MSGGIASFMPGGMLPLSSITEAINFPLGLTGNSLPFEDFFANFVPISGGTLIEQEVARYPFLNQVTAANAVIGQPLHIAMLMICPAKSDFGYYTRLAIISALQAALVLHNGNGGTYMVATPSYIYPNCIMRRMSDVSSGLSKQPQTAWMIEFEQPLLALTPGGAIASQSSMLQLLSSLGFVDASSLSWSGAFSSIPTPSLAGPAATPPLAGITQGIGTGNINGGPITVSTLPSL